MNVHVFKTDISTKHLAKCMKPIFNNNPVIAEWSVDTEDIDNVLRVVTTPHLCEQDIIDLVNAYGFQCNVLPD